MPARLHAQETRPARILFLLDASSSMLNGWNTSDTRFQTAARLVNAIVDSVHASNRDVAFAIRVFGNQSPAQDKDCYDTRLEVPFNLGNDEQIRARLKYLSPRGFSPIAWSLRKTAEEDFTESDRYAYSIILITDGGESCGGDICATVTSLLDKKISFKPYILSLIDYEPLKLQYECLGKYLTVATEKDIVPAIATIINDNRKILSIRNTGLQSIRPAGPPVAAAREVKPVIPAVQQPRVESRIEPLPEKNTPVPETAPPVEPPVSLPKVIPVDKIVMQTRLKKLNLLFALPDGIPYNVPPLGRISLARESAPGLPGTVETPPVKTTEPRRQASAVVEPSAPVNRPRTTPVKNPALKKKEEEKLDFVVKEEEARESSLQIYFTNGQGRFFSTEPKLQIRDSKTGKEVKSGYRTVTAGTPDLIKLPPGVYDIIIPGTKSKATGVEVTEGKNKKYYIKVGSGSLAFYYPSAPDRPVKEYMALVSKRFEPGPVVKQRCEEELPYDPANYHIEINTLPAMMLNVDLDFNGVKLISIEEPGMLQVANKVAMGKVQLWCQRGDSYVPFYEMAITGRPETQHVNLLPGVYQLRYYKTPGAAPTAKAEIVSFRIKSNMSTSLELGK